MNNLGVDPLYILKPVPITFGSFNLGRTREEQIANGVFNPDPVAWQEGDAVFRGELRSSPPDSLIPATGLEANIPNDYKSLIFGTEAQEAYAAAVRDGSISTSPTSQADLESRSLDNAYVCLRDTDGSVNPDSEQRLRDNVLVTDPENPVWAPLRKLNKASFNDGRPTHLIARRDVVQFVVNCNQGINAISLNNIRASRVAWTFRHNGILYGADVNLTDIGNISTWQEYLLQRPRLVQNYIIRGLPTVSHDVNVPIANQLVITLYNPGALASIGQVVMGEELQIGMADGDAFRSQLLDFSRVATDPFGVLDVTARPRTFTNTVSCIFDKKDGSFVRETLVDIGAGQPFVLYLSPDEFIGTSLFGVMTSGDLRFLEQTSDKSRVNITQQGII